MVIGIIAAMNYEAETIINNLEDFEEEIISGTLFNHGYIGSNEVIVASAGVGKVNSAVATILLIDNYHPNLIINSGIAGGGTMDLDISDIVIGEKLIYNDVDATIFGYQKGQVPKMPVYYESDINAIVTTKSILNQLGYNYKTGLITTGDSFITDINKLLFIPNETFAFDMEGASIAQACFKAGTPFLSIRFISDVYGKSHVEDYMAFEDEASKKSANLTLEIIKSFE